MELFTRTNLQLCGLSPNARIQKRPSRYKIRFFGSEGLEIMLLYASVHILYEQNNLFLDKVKGSEFDKFVFMNNYGYILREQHEAYFLLTPACNGTPFDILPLWGRNWRLRRRSTRAVIMGEGYETGRQVTALAYLGDFSILFACLPGCASVRRLFGPPRYFTIPDLVTFLTRAQFEWPGDYPFTLDGESYYDLEIRPCEDHHLDHLLQGIHTRSFLNHTSYQLDIILPRREEGIALSDLIEILQARREEGSFYEEVIVLAGRGETYN